MRSPVILTLPIVFSATALAGCSSTDEATSQIPTSSPSAAASATTSETASPTGSETADAASEITFKMSIGNVVIKTDPAANETVAAQSKLAGDGYFDGTPCHRIVTQGIFVLQCGDPTGTGTGDPGYTLPDENLPGTAEANYPRGTVAMANAGPGTAGSQFFIVYKDTTLPPAYTIWGEVTEGLKAVEDAAAESKAAGITDGPPQPPVEIESASAS